MTRIFSLIPILAASLMIYYGTSRPTSGGEIGFIEKYALAADRQAILESLIPGSEDYYFFHCLHYQVTGNLDRAEAMLSDWEAKIQGDSAERIAIRDRQRLLTYGASPERTIEYLRNRLSIELDHAPPPQAGQRRWPDSLDPAMVDPANLLREAAGNHEPLSQLGLIWLAEKALAGEAQLYNINLEWLTQQVHGRWYSRLGELVVAELNARRPENRAFGDRAAHSQLTLNELQNLIKVFPDFANNRNLVNQILLRMRPGADKNVNEQPEVRLQYLIEINRFVQSLPESQNSLKAATLYRLLEAQMMQGEFPLDLFLQYLRLPRQSPIVFVNPRMQGQNRAYAANLSEDFNAVALLPPIRDEQPLVRAYLEHFLRDASSTEQFTGLVEKEYLNRVFAETKLLFGIGQPQQWFELLTAGQRQTLTDAIELTLSPTNRRFLATTGASAEDIGKVVIDVKGVDELIVRIYEINTHAYYRTRSEAIDTNIDLDGLVATEEQRYEYKFPKIRRHRETIALPAVTGRGVWIVDFLGGGLRSRAVLRRGDLRFIEQQTANGQMLTVLDEKRSPVPGARLWIAGQELAADQQGQITIPPLDQALSRNAVLMDDQIAVPLTMVQNGEQYSLQAGMLVNREQLIAGQMAELIIRPRLYMASTAVDPSMLEDVSVTVVAVDQDGISTTRKFEHIKLSQAEETTIKFRVPVRLASLTTTLAGQIKTLATGRVNRVQDEKTWEVNATEKTSNTMDVHLTRDGLSWLAEVRGLNGEPISGVMVQATLTSIYRPSTVNTTLETNDEGKIFLGALSGVRQVALAISGNTVSRVLATDFAYWPERLHGVSNEAISLPLAQNITQEEAENSFRIVELRTGQPAQDLTDKYLKLDNGMLVLGPLPAGDYHLFHEHHGMFLISQVAITEGPIVAGIAAGEVRNLELQWPKSVAIANVETNDQEVIVQLAGDYDLARVHVVARRYLPELDSADLPLPPPNYRTLKLPESGYVSDLRLGDEYLYVLRRQYAKKYPGVMLPQASLLIAPWVTDETSTDRSVAREGEALPLSAAMPSPAADMLGRRGRFAETPPSLISQSVEFLATPGIVLANLRPDQDGRVRVPRENLKGLHLIEVVAIDPFATIRRVVAYPIEKLEPRDRRVTNPLPSEKPFAFEREVLVAGPDRPLKMASLGTAQIQVYAELQEVLQLYRTISGDQRLDEFADLGRWNTLDLATKRDLYGRLACHELHVFLKFKDPDFFDSVVRPYLADKKEKKLIDDWLLGNDLAAWTELWRYVRLNAFEKALLAHTVPEMRESVIREFQERVALQETDPSRLRELIDIGLAGKAMDASPEFVAGMAFGAVAEGEHEEFGMMEALAPGSPAPGGMGGMGGMGMGGGQGMGGYGTESMEAVADSESADAEKQSVLRSEVVDARRMQGARGIMTKRAENMGRMLFFQQLDSTKQWAENHWDRVRTVDADGELIPLDPFWLQWAKQTGPEPFICTDLLRPSSNRHAALVALALLDLPFEANSVELPSEADGVYQPKQSVAVITKRLRALEPNDQAASLLVGQRFEAADTVDQGPFTDGQEVRIAPQEFLVGRAYKGQIVITNPTPQMRKVEVLWQIPEGSLPLAGSQATDSRTVYIAPFEVQRVDYQFYFPRPGDYRHYPVCISNDSKVVARGDVRQFNVVASPTMIDEASWEQVARAGSADKIRQFLANANLRNIDWSLVAHRMRDRAIYDVVMPILETAKIWRAELWGYAFLYRDQLRITTYLDQQTDLAGQVGPVFRSQLLVVEPISRALYEHLEYAPLVPDRIHPLRLENEIMNDRFLQQYRSLMRVIAYQPAAADDQKLALCYYFLLQNRIEEAILMFTDLPRENASLGLQYDYMAAYLALHQANYQLAGELAAKYAEHPVPRWRERFGQLQSQLLQRRNLISGSKLVGTAALVGQEGKGVREDAADLAVLDREQRLEDGAAGTPDLRVRVEGDALIIDHRNTREANLRFYGIDLELLFSKTPFVREGLEKMAMVRASTVETIALGEGDGTARYPLPEKLARQTLLVEVISGSARDTTLYYGGRLKTYVSEGFGQLQVSDRTTADPVSTAYVKVYAKHRSGEIQFYKDGYTDLRGRFDYATLSTGDLTQIEKFALLVLDPERGATLHEVNPPTR